METGSASKDESRARAALRSRTISGLSWSAITQISHQLLKFGIVVVLARILSPREFGLVAMLAVFTGFARLLTDLGFGASLVHKKHLRPEHLDTVFWLNVATGLALTLLFTALAPLIARFYDEPILAGLTMIVALNFLFSSLNVVQNSLLQKSMDFRRLFWIDLAAMSIGGGTAIVLALKGFGVWSLVIETVIITVVSVIVMWLLSPWRPAFQFRLSALRELFRFSGNLLASNAVFYWSRNFDALLIGKVLGGASAGIYHRAYQLMLLPLSQVTTVVTRVMFPALASIQDNIPRVRSVYLRATRIISLVTFPLMVLLLVLSEPAILLVYGTKWSEVIPLFQILCFAGLAQSVGVTIGWIYLSQGRTDLQFKWGLVATSIRILGFIIGIRWGLMGVAVSYVLTGYCITWYPAWTIAGRLIGLNFTTMVRNLAPTFFCSSFAGAVVWAFDSALFQHSSHFLRLLLGLTLGFSTYLVALWAFRVGAWIDLMDLARVDRFSVVRRAQPFLKFIPGIAAVRNP